MDVPTRKVGKAIENETGKCFVKGLINRKAEVHEKQSDMEQQLSNTKEMERNDPHAFAKMCYSRNQTVQVTFFHFFCTLMHKTFEKQGSVLITDNLQ